MSTAQWVFVIVFLVIIPIIVFIIIEFTNFLRPLPSIPEDTEPVININELLNPSGWGNPEPLEGDLGKCALYQTSSLTTLNDTPIISTFPSDCENLGISNVSNCCQDIGNTIIARKVRRTCKIPINDQIAPPCISINGTIVPPGTVEEYFEQCPGIVCEGVLQQIRSQGQCIGVEPDDETLELKGCNRFDSRQVFRVTWRAQKDTASVTLSNLTLIQKRPDIGNFAQIYHRETDKYINVDGLLPGDPVKMTITPGFNWVRVPPEGDTVQQLAVSINDIPFVRNLNPDPLLTMNTGVSFTIENGTLDDLGATTQQLEFTNV